jgi:hypothetical protein
MSAKPIVTTPHPMVSSHDMQDYVTLTMYERDIQAIKDSQTRIEKAITGDVTMGLTGIVEQVKNIKAETESHKIRFVYWTGITVGILAAYEFIKDCIFK